jgi:hypothetical protein
MLAWNDGSNGHNQVNPFSVLYLQDFW